MKNKSIKAVLPWFLFSCACLILSVFLLPNIIFPRAQTLDFRGYVQEIDINYEENVALISANAVWGSEHKVLITVPLNTSCLLLDGRNIPVDNIKIGDMIDFDYKGQWGLNDDGVFEGTAKWITVCHISD